MIKITNLITYNADQPQATSQNQWPQYNDWDKIDDLSRSMQCNVMRYLPGPSLILNSIFCMNLSIYLIKPWAWILPHYLLWHWDSDYHSLIVQLIKHIFHCLEHNTCLVSKYYNCRNIDTDSCFSKLKPNYNLHQLSLGRTKFSQDSNQKCTYIAT